MRLQTQLTAEKAAFEQRLADKDRQIEELRKMLGECIAVISDINRKTTEIAASITADIAPSHIRKNAEYVGALVYLFYSADKLAERLYEMNWLKSVENTEKPAICVVRS